MITKLQRQAFRAFSTSTQAAQSAADPTATTTDLRAKIDPVRKQVDNFLQHVNVFEEQNLDVEMPYVMSTERLPGFATQQGTDRYYRRS